MTREEAIETLKTNYPDACYEQLREAVDTAISSLQAQDVPDTNVGDTISRQAAIEGLADEVVGGLEKIKAGYGNDWLGGMHTAWRVLDDLPSTQPEKRTEKHTETHECDYISRQAAIDALEREKTYCTAYKDGYTQTDYFKQYNMGLTDGIKALNKLPSAQPQQWIPVAERLPIPNERIGNVRKYYLIQNEYGDMMVACYSGEWEQIYRHEYCLDKVVAWMPLPKPYETQESEDKE